MCDCVCVCFWMDEQTEITEGLPVVEPTYAHPHTTHAHVSRATTQHGDTGADKVVFFLVSFKYACGCQ